MSSTSRERGNTGLVIRVWGTRRAIPIALFLVAVSWTAAPVSAQGLGNRVKHDRRKLEFADTIARTNAEATMNSLRTGASIAFQLVVVRPLETMEGERHAIFMSMSGDLISRLLGTIQCGPERKHLLRVLAFPVVREWGAGEEDPREWGWGVSGMYSHGASVLVEAWGNDALDPAVTYDFLPSDGIQDPTTTKMLIRYDRQQALVSFDLFGRPIEEVRLINDSGLGEVEPGDRTLFQSLVVQPSWTDRFPITTLRPFIFALAFIQAFR